MSFSARVCVSEFDKNCTKKRTYIQDSEGSRRQKQGEVGGYKAEEATKKKKIIYIK